MAPDYTATMLSCARASQLIPGQSDGLFSWQIILFRDMLVESLLCAGKQKVLLVYSRSSRTRRDQYKLVPTQTIQFLSN